ncbi:MAG: hypothetical protein AB1428_13660 [Bacteroidota bacterium]
MTRFPIAAGLIAAFTLCTAHAQDENPLTRDEVAQVKKKLVAMLDAIGKPPAGYTVEHENFDLPTEAYKTQASGRYYPVSAGANREYGTRKKAEKAGEDVQKEYQKKMLEAQAKGDYQEMTKLAQEMQKKVSAQQLEAVEGQKEPIAVAVRCNGNPGATIDPDAVVFERTGVIALKYADAGSGDRTRVAIYCDPVSLKNTKQLSRVDMKMPEQGITKRNAVLNVTIEFTGPADAVEAWAKAVDTGKVLAQIDAAR